MTFSARRLGNLYGLTAEEMNYLLKLQGFQEGEPGNYSPTEKGKRFMISKGADNGYGGYAFRGWDWNEWDESIISELNVNEAVKASVREDVVQLRKERRLRREAEAESYWEEQQKKKRTLIIRGGRRYDVNGGGDKMSSQNNILLIAKFREKAMGEHFLQPSYRFHVTVTGGRGSAWLIAEGRSSLSWSRSIC